jgi:hypothetical protein
MALTVEAGERIQIRLPTAVPAPAEAAPTFVVDGPLSGLRVGLRHEGSWRSWMLIVDEWTRFLRRDGAEPVILQTGERVGAEGEQTREAIESWVASIDCAVSGLGTCGSCTSWTVSDAVAAEAGHKPAVAAVTSEFEIHARNMASYLGHGDLKVLVLPYPLEALPEDELRQIASDYYPQFLDAIVATR